VPLADFSFFNVVLAIHIAAVIVGFGVTFAYPILFSAATRSDPRALPALHRAQRIIGSRLITGGLVVVLIAGIYLAHKDGAFKYFYVQWGFGAVLVIGAVSGAYFAPRERQLIELADRDVAHGKGPEATVTMSAEYLALASQVRAVSAAMSALVLVTVLFMATQLGTP
jgi:hypothetical protein